MKTILSFLFLTAAAALGPPAPCAEPPLVLPLWPGKAPGEYGRIGPEHIRAPDNSPTKDAKWLTNVTVPTLTVYRPPKEKDTGAAMIVCPGGGYWNLAWDLEGTEVAEWLNTAGITGIVLKYRVPRRPAQPTTLPAPLPQLDAQRAVSLVRSKATEWGIDPKRIGMVGFSAGGHLVLATATSFDRRHYEPVDEIDQVSCRPDFVVPVYSGYFVEPGRHVLHRDIRVPAGTPPVLLIHAGDDDVSDAENSVLMYQALKKAGVPAGLHVYQTGRHGFGVRKTTRPGSDWTARCLDWLANQGMLKRAD